MKKITHIKYGLYTLAMLLMLNTISCKNSTKKNKTEPSQISESLAKKSIKKEIEEVVYPLPTSFELTSMLNRIGADYIIALCNPAENADKYFTEKSRALNLGVFGADLSYASTYHQKQETMLYLKASRTLIDNLEITSAFNKTFVDRVQNNLDNKNQLIKIITNSFYDTYSFLNKNKKANLSLLVISGSFVEGLYIATHISENTFNNTEMVKVIFSQKKSLDRLVELLGPEKKDPNIASLLSDLTDLKEKYDAIDTSMTEDQLNEITNSVRKLRENIIN